MKVGDKAEDFTLKNSEGEDSSLSQLTKGGKALLLFFPLAFSGTCTDEMCTMRDNMKAYNSLNANVAGISVDSYFTLSEFKKSNNLNFPLLSDFNKEVTKSFGALYNDFIGMKGVAKRSAFIISSNMEVEYVEILEDAGNLPNFKAIQDALKE